MRELIVHLTFISTLCTTTHHLVPPHITWFGVSPGDSDLPGTCDEFVFRLSSCFQFGQSLALRSGHSRDSICRDTFALVEFLIRLFDPEQEYLYTVIPSTWQRSSLRTQALQSVWELTSTMPETGDDANPSPEQATPRASTGPVSTTETRLIDTKGLLQVSPYFGVRASFLGKGWSACEEYKKNRASLGNTSRMSRLSAWDPELADQAYILLASLCKDEASGCVRSAEDRTWVSGVAGPLAGKNGAELYDSETRASLFGSGIRMLRRTRLEQESG